MPEALTRKVLDDADCGVPDCTHDHTVLYLQSACHIKAGTFVSYHKDTGVLSINCEVCDQLVAQVKVAKE